MYLSRKNWFFGVASLGSLVPGRVLDGGTQWWNQGGICFFCLLFLFWFTEQGSLIPGRVGLATLTSGGAGAPGKIGPVPAAEARTILETMPCSTQTLPYAVVIIPYYPRYQNHPRFCHQPKAAAGMVITCWFIPWWQDKDKELVSLWTEN